MTIDENYTKAAEVVSTAIAMNVEQYREAGTSPWKALLTPREFHEEVFRLAATMGGWSVVGDTVTIVGSRHGLSHSLSRAIV